MLLCTGVSQCLHSRPKQVSWSDAVSVIDWVSYVIVCIYCRSGNHCYISTILTWSALMSVTLLKWVYHAHVVKILNVYVYGTYVVSINISTFVFLVCILTILLLTWSSNDAMDITTPISSVVRSSVSATLHYPLVFIVSESHRGESGSSSLFSKTALSTMDIHTIR